MTSPSTISPLGRPEPKPQNPIVFLDIDGVLNSVQFMMQHPKTRTQIDERCVELLNELTETTGCKYVISSTWRMMYPIEELQKILNAKGFTGEIIGKTENLQIGRFGDSVLRGNEILQWIKNNGNHTGGAFYSEYKRYVIFDDDSDFLLWQKDNFINTDGYIGLTPKCIYKATKILGTKETNLIPPY